VLLIHFSLAPSEGREELEGADGMSARLEVIEDPLHAKGDAVEVLHVGRHLIDGSSEVSDEKEGLKERVQVASSALINQTVVQGLLGLLRSPP
jgi:hypothetical protein